jgi:hypothetical protein
MKIDFEKRHIGQGFYYITEKEAKAICDENNKNGFYKPSLPGHGWERKVQFDKRVYWIGRTIVDGNIVWSLRELD